MMRLIISPKVLAKLAGKTPPVNAKEIYECFLNRDRTYVLDTREDHKSDPPTRWFIAETLYGRKLKIAFIPLDTITIRSAFNPNAQEMAMYLRKSKPLNDEGEG